MKQTMHATSKSNKVQNEKKEHNKKNRTGERRERANYTTHSNSRRNTKSMFVLTVVQSTEKLLKGT